MRFYFTYGLYVKDNTCIFIYWKKGMYFPTGLTRGSGSIFQACDWRIQLFQDKISKKIYFKEYEVLWIAVKYEALFPQINSYSLYSSVIAT